MALTSVDPEKKRVHLEVQGPSFDVMVQAALIEAASFLGMDVADLAVLDCGVATVVEWTRFTGDLSNEKFPAKWTMGVTVGVDIPDAEPKESDD
jgi:hypothetical protein